MVDNWHIKFLCDELQKVGLELKARVVPEFKQLIINIPPGTSKSTIVTIMFPAWCWCIDPTLRFITGSYSSELSTEHSVKSRDIIKSEKYRALFSDIGMKSDQDNKMLYENTNQGTRTVTSVGGTITGKHAHCIIIDDPINPEQAYSEAERNTANRWMKETIPTRKVDKRKAVTIMVMQRLHEKDPTGVKLANNNGDIKHICLPAELSTDVSPESVREQYVEGLLDPIRMDANTLSTFKVDLGSYGYAGQFQQRPSPMEGGILKKHWFKTFTIEELTTKIRRKWGQNINVEKYMIKKFYSDTAYGQEASDNSATMTYTVFRGSLYIWDMWKVNLGLPAFKRDYIALLQRMGYVDESICYFEPKSTGISVVQELKELYVPIGNRRRAINVVEDEPPKDSKVTRVMAASPIVESGRVYLMQGAPWVDSFLGECASFPNGLNDDQVDCLSAAIRLHLQDMKKEQNSFDAGFI